MTQSSDITGKTKDAGFQVGARKTFSIPLEEAWNFITSEGLSIWLGNMHNRPLKPGLTYFLDNGCYGEIRVFSTQSHLRLTWQPPNWPRPSTIQVRVIPNGAKTVIAFHQEHLPGLAEREERKLFFKNVLKQIEDKFS